MKRNLILHSGVLFIGLLVGSYPAMAAWGPFGKIGTNQVVGDPSCTFLKTGHAVCGVQSLAHTLLVTQYGGTWSAWQDLGGSLTSNPSCTDDGTGRAVCAAQSSTGAMVAATFNGTTWAKVALVGGQTTSGPSCAELTARGTLCASRAASRVDGPIAFSTEPLGDRLAV